MPGHLVRYGLWLAVAGSVLAFFLPAAGRLGSWQGILELAVGVVLTAEGALLVSDWHGARRRLVQGWVDRAGNPAGLLHALRFRTLGYLLFGLGLVWLAVGVIELGQGLLELL
jgi:hypothetical protein